MKLCFIHILAGAQTEGRNTSCKSLPGERSFVIAIIIPSWIIYDKPQRAECTEKAMCLRAVCHGSNQAGC